MSKFSQGKWYVDSANIIRCDDEYDRSIAKLITSSATKELDEANARLILAAPTLYYCLKSLYRMLSRTRPDLAYVAGKILAEVDGTEEAQS